MHIIFESIYFTYVILGSLKTKLLFMKRKQLIKTLLFIITIYGFSAHVLIAQVTTATLSGIVTDAKGAPLEGATVTVAYPDAGIK